MSTTSKPASMPCTVTNCQDATKTFLKVHTKCSDISQSLTSLQQTVTLPEETRKDCEKLLGKLSAFTTYLAECTKKIKKAHTHNNLTAPPENQQTRASSTQQKGYDKTRSVEEAPKHKVKKLTDDELMYIVSSFYDNDLYNYLDGVHAEDEDRAWQDVQKVTMSIHKLAYDKLRDHVVQSQLSLPKVRPKPLEEFVGSMSWPQKKPTDADIQGPFDEWFLKVHCGLQAPRPPSDVKSSLPTMDAVLGVKGEAFNHAVDYFRLFHDQQCEALQNDCLQRLDQKIVLQTYVKEKLSALAAQICRVVSAMLLHSLPIIPFTGQPKFLDAYHEPNVSASQDFHGRSELVYRTPYLYYYSYGKLITLQKASVTFVIPPQTSLPMLGDRIFIDKMKALFREEQYTDQVCQEANLKTSDFANLYSCANGILTTTMRQDSRFTAALECLLKLPERKSPYPKEFVQAFNKRHEILCHPENAALLTSIQLKEQLREYIKTKGRHLLQKSGDAQAAVDLVVALLCSPDPWIPFGLKDNRMYEPHFHATEVCQGPVTGDCERSLKQHDSFAGVPAEHRHEIKYLLRPLVWSPTASEPLVRATVILK